MWGATVYPGERSRPSSAARYPALRPGCRPERLQLERYLFGDVLPKPAADEVAHQIKRRGTPDARQAIAVDHKQFVCKMDSRKLLAQHVQVFPIHSAAVAVEQP